MRPPSVERLALAGVDLEEHVLEARLRRAAARWRPRACSRLYFGSISSSTTAWPSSSSTLPMSPTRTPATRTVWPWPGVTAWASASSALTVKGLLLDQREAQPLLRQDVARRSRGRARPRRGSRGSRARCLRIAVLIGWPPPASAPAPDGGRRRRAPWPPAAARCPRSRRCVGELPGRRDRSGRLDDAPSCCSSTGKAGIGPPGACRFGSSCFSHGTSGTVRHRLAAAVGRRARPDAIRRAASAPAWKNWLLPSERRLSPERPGKPRWSCERTSWSCVLGLVARLRVRDLRGRMNGTSTLFVQADSARFSRRNGTEVRLNATTSGIVWRSTRAVPRSSSSDMSRRAWVMNGSDASSVSSEERTPGQCVAGEGAQRRQRRVERLPAPDGRSSACRAAPGSPPPGPRPRARMRPRSR